MNRFFYCLLYCFMLLAFNVNAQTAYTGMRNITGIEIAVEMAPGLNLFNTLDACGSGPQGLESENYWGQPTTTVEMIAAMADRGFKTLRIPVTWFNHMGPYPEYAIDTAWMNRVEEVANYAFDNNMYVILNIHHDDLQEGRVGSWLNPTYESQDTVIDQLEKVWTQIANRFIDYGDYLIFEAMNEPREVGSSQEWSGGSAEHRDVINSFNQAAVDAIRATGGNNESRFIMIPQNAANGGTAITDLIIPNDDPNIIVSTHAYYPFSFCLDGNGSDTWGTPSEISELQGFIQSLSDHFVANGRAVVMGEWGAGDKDNYAQRVNYYDVYTQACYDGGITPVVWIYGFNRTELTWDAPMIEDAILHVYDSAVVDVEEIILNVSVDTLYAGDSLQLNATILPDTATYQYVIWATNRKSIATIDNNGLVRGVGNGLVTISASSIGVSAEVELYVIDTITQVNFQIEAEDFDEQSGVQTESCSEGGLNIGYIENNDWSSYRVGIDSAGTYDFIVRAATDTDGGTIEIEVDNILVGEVEVDGSLSAGWQDWYSTAPIEILLDKGIQDIKLTYKGGGGSLFNVNWFQMNFLRPVSIEGLYKEPAIKVYPNPVSDRLTIELLGTQSRIELYGLDGRCLYVKESSENKVQLDMNAYKAGTYIIKVSSYTKNVAKKIIVE